MRTGPSVTTGLPPETIVSPLPQHSRCLPNHGRSGNEKQQHPHMSNKLPAIVIEAIRARNMR